MELAYLHGNWRNITLFPHVQCNFFFFFFLRNQYFLATHETIGSLGVEGNYGYTPIEKNEKETALSLRSSTVAITYTKEKQK